MDVCDRYNYRCEANYILMINTMLLALCMFVIPFCQVLLALAFVLAVMGFNMGSVDTLANLQMIAVFGDAVPPFLQVCSAISSTCHYRMQADRKEQGPNDRVGQEGLGC